jgi:hypothetical protein
MSIDILRVDKRRRDGGGMEGRRNGGTKGEISAQRRKRAQRRCWLQRSAAGSAQTRWRDVPLSFSALKPLGAAFTWALGRMAGTHGDDVPSRRAEYRSRAELLPRIRPAFIRHGAGRTRPSPAPTPRGGVGVPTRSRMGRAATAVGAWSTTRCGWPGTADRRGFGQGRRSPLWTAGGRRVGGT